MPHDRAAGVKNYRPHILEALIESNRQRIKTNGHIGREANALLGIEKERAKVRQKATLKQGTKKPVVELVPQPKPGKSRDAVGQKLGISGKTAERAGKVVDVLDTLTKTGKTQEAAQLKKTLTKNVSKAYQAAKVIEAQSQPLLPNGKGAKR